MSVYTETMSPYYQTGTFYKPNYNPLNFEPIIRLMETITESISMDIEDTTATIYSKPKVQMISECNNVFGHTRDFTEEEERKFNSIVDGILDKQGRKTGFKLDL